MEPGETRMRIVSHWLSSSGDISPCATGFTYGEFEDYTFEVIELEDCEGMPTAGTPDETEMMVCAGISCTVSVSDARSEEHTSELQSRGHLVCGLPLLYTNTTSYTLLFTKNIFIS